MLTTVPDGAVHVVAAVLVSAGTVFIAQRAADSHQGGKWEFPGGKVHAGENAYAALQRELREETGIEVNAARPLVRITHAYPDKKVFLDVWRVETWAGVPHGREGQSVRWADIGTLHPSEFPAADRPVLWRLQLPPLYVISNALAWGSDVFLRKLETAVVAGVRLVQLRESGMAEADFAALAREVVPLCRRHGARILLNAEPALVLECGADGVHLNGARLRSLTMRPLDPNRFVAASCHNAEELLKAAAIGADFAVLSPVASTPSHPDAVALGWDRLADLTARTEIPVYALGGMRGEDVDAAIAAGAQGVALMRGVWDVPDITAVVHRVLGDQAGAAASLR
jgi:8-oxo-dGTP diphosphatase